jgi:L-lactate permease
VKKFVKKHPQLLMSFVQVTLSQVALWSFIPPKAVAIVSGLAGLFQAWLALFYKYIEEEQKTEGESETQEGV